MVNLVFNQSIPIFINYSNIKWFFWCHCDNKNHLYVQCVHQQISIIIFRLNELQEVFLIRLVTI